MKTILIILLLVHSGLLFGMGIKKSDADGSVFSRLLYPFLPTDWGSQVSLGNLIGGEEVTINKEDFNSIVIFSGAAIGCTGAKIAESLYLLAGHCVIDYQTGKVKKILEAGSALSIRQSDKEWRKTKVVQTFTHPSYMREMQRRITEQDGHSYLAGFTSSDVALIKIKDSYSDISSSSISFDRVNNDEIVKIMGTGCEISTGSQAKYTRRLKVKDVKIINHEHAENNSARAQAKDIDLVNFLTEGKNFNNQAASLCPGDSGGPVFTRDSKKIIGVNAYYTFNDNSGVAYTNLHTRLDLEDVKQWIEDIALDYNITLD